MLNPSLGYDLEASAILIVDDNQANIELLKEILGQRGFHNVTGLTDPRDAVSLCAETAFDILLVDIRMPHMSGIELMEQLQPLFRDDYMPILVLTAQTDQTTRRRSLESGATDFLTKPFVVWELVQRVRNMLQSRALYKQVRDQNRLLELMVTERTKELTDALQRSRMADRAKLDFLAVMSHELRTPLNSIIGFAEIMNAQHHGPLGDPEYAEYVQLIEDSGRHLLTMVNRILEFTKGSGQTPELYEREVDLVALIDTCVATLEPRAQERRITVACGPRPQLRLLADERRLREVLLNILDNAIKFAADDGSGAVTLSVDRTADGVSVAITDDGPGIDPAIQDSLFDPFTQGDEGTLVRRYGGIGLGLPIARRYMDLHGGFITIYSVPGNGTTVTMTLPATRILIG